MSVIQTIRDKYAAVSIVIIAISLIAFILMDALNSKSSWFNDQSNVIGEINGKEISALEFDRKLKSMDEKNKKQEDLYKRQGIVNETPFNVTLDNVWNNVLIETILEEEYNKTSIVFTDVDMEDAVFSENTPQELKEILLRPDVKKTLKSSKNSAEKDMLISYLNESLIIPTLQNKYFSIIKSSNYYPKWLYEKEQNDNYSISSINYVNVPYSTIPDASIKISDEEIKAYVDKHKDDFKQEKSATISYVVFDGSAKSQDSMRVINELSQKITDFSTSQDVNAFLNLNSSETKFNDLFVLRSKIISQPGDTIFNLQKDAVYGPYLDGNSYSLVKFIDKKIIPDSVKCRHILIDTRPKEDGSVTPDSIAKARIDSISLAISEGADFSLMATKFSDDIGSKDKGGEYSFSYNDFTNLTIKFAEYIFYEPTGSKSVIKTDFGYHLIEVLEQNNIQEGYKFAYFKRKILPSEETINDAFSKAMNFTSSVTDKASFEKAVKDNKLTASTAVFSTTDHDLRGLGNARKLIRWTFDNKIGDVSKTEQVGDFIVVALITEKKEKGTMNVKSARPIVEPILLNIKKAQLIIAKAGNQKDFNTLADKFNTKIETADSIFFGSQFINSIGSEPKLIGASFNTAFKNSVSAPIAGNTGVFYIRVLSNSLASSTGETYEMRRKQTEDRNIINSIIEKSIYSLKKGSEIVDNRIMFY